MSRRRWFMGGALAGIATVAVARPPTRDVLQIPLTPGDGPEPYAAVVDVPKAGDSTWSADIERFGCRGTGDFLELVVDPADWPSVIPTKVRCYAEDGRKISVPVEIAAEPRRPMLTGDGTLVMPRTKGSSAIYEGTPPRDDLVVQQGQSEGLALTCGIDAGAPPRLRVVVNPSEPDGSGTCVVRTRFGDDVRVPIRVITVKER